MYLIAYVTQLVVLHRKKCARKLSAAHGSAVLGSVGEHRKSSQDSQGGAAQLAEGTRSVAASIRKEAVTEIFIYVWSLRKAAEIQCQRVCRGKEGKDFGDELT